jgi:hypothetical protein
MRSRPADRRQPVGFQLPWILKTGSRDRRGKDFGSIIEATVEFWPRGLNLFLHPSFVASRTGSFVSPPSSGFTDAKLDANVKRCVILRHYPDYQCPAHSKSRHRKAAITMKLRLPFLLLLAISGPAALGMQAAPALHLHAIRVNPEAQAAQNQAVDARKRLLLVNESVQKAIAKAETDRSPAAQADAVKAQQQVASAQNAADDAQKKARAVESQPVTDQDWKQIQNVLQTYKNRYESSMNHYGVLATTLLLAGIVLAAASAIAGFMRKSIAAGIVSIIVTCVVGVPKVIPINQRAEYYRALFGQSSTLLVRSQLRLHPTITDYNEFVDDINVLSDYETNKFPSGGNVAANTESLIKDIAATSITQ